MCFYDNLPVELWFIIYKIEHHHMFKTVIDQIKNDRKELNIANKILIADTWCVVWPLVDEYDLWTYIEHKLFVEYYSDEHGGRLRVPNWRNRTIFKNCRQVMTV